MTAVAIDPSGKWVLAAGYTNSPDLPVTHDAFQKRLGGGTDGFLLVLEPASGKLLYGTYLGGPGDDSVAAIRLVPNGQILVAGVTRSREWLAAASARRFGRLGGLDGFVMRVDLQARLTHSAILIGGIRDDAVSGIGVNEVGDLFIAGTTDSADFPISGRRASSNGSGFVARISGALVSPAAWSIKWSRRVGGSGEDALLALTVGTGSSVLVVGRSSSTDFPTTQGAMYAKLSARNDSILVKLDAVDGSVEYATFVGGTQVQNASWYNDEATSIHTGPNGDAFLTGCTLGGRLGVSGRAFQTRPAGNSEPFVLRLRFSNR